VELELAALDFPVGGKGEREGRRAERAGLGFQNTNIKKGGRKGRGGTLPPPHWE